MSDSANKPCQATPHKDLMENIMDVNIPKSEREWAARNEIQSLQAKNKKLVDGLKVIAKNPYCSDDITYPLMAEELLNELEGE